MKYEIQESDRDALESAILKYIEAAEKAGANDYDMALELEEVLEGCGKRFDVINCA